MRVLDRLRKYKEIILQTPGEAVSFTGRKVARSELYGGHDFTIYEKKDGGYILFYEGGGVEETKAETIEGSEEALKKAIDGLNPRFINAKKKLLEDLVKKRIVSTANVRKI